jgi:hypothetical protein
MSARTSRDEDRRLEQDWGREPIAMLNDLIAELKCAKCLNFRYVVGGTLIIYFELNIPNTGINTFWIDCAWRLRKGDEVLIGSLDHSFDILPELQQLQGCTLTNVSISPDTYDIVLSFDSNLTIETFGYSICDEHWEFRRGDGLRIGLGPGFQPYSRFVEPE